MKGETVEIGNVRAIKETAAALLCVIEDAHEWVPKSQIHDNSEVWRDGDVGTLVVTEWLAKKRGWV